VSWIWKRAYMLSLKPPISKISEIEFYTQKNYLIEKPILRIFHDEKEKELWLKKSGNIG